MMTEFQGLQMSIIEDYIFPRTVKGRGSKVTHLPGSKITVYREVNNYKKPNPIEIDEPPTLGLISDLMYYSRKRAISLRVPASYLP